MICTYAQEKGLPLFNVRAKPSNHHSRSLNGADLYSSKVFIILTKKSRPKAANDEVNKSVSQLRNLVDDITLNNMRVDECGVEVAMPQILL